ncbi:MAG: NUDIX domain-containing protein [Gemmatimonadota bacterium]|nr:NUDIX domain-containing protein [Gemmatimonadota bacterium]
MTDDQAANKARATRTVTERIEREEFARGHVGEKEVPTEPRDAATIVLAREAPELSEAFDILLLKRPSTSRFAAGAYVFPGGTIDPDDGQSHLATRLPNSGPDAEPAAVLAALRELFEETGLLLTDERPDDAELAHIRRELLEGGQSFGASLEQHDLSFTSLDVCYFARWVTPSRFARRYDTRFFVTVLPESDVAFEPHLTDEIADCLWVSPARAVELFRAGRLPMLFPTRITLQALAEFKSVAEMFSVFRSRRIEALTPRLLIRGDSIRPVLPGDPEYDEADG